MTDLRRPCILLATFALVLAACGGGDGGSNTGGGGTTSAAPEGGAATSGPTEAAPVEAPTEPAGGGGTATGVCELVTADELAAIFGVPSVAMTLLAGPPDNCIIDSADGSSLAAWSLTATGAKVIFGSYVSGSDANEVPGIGDLAIYNPDGYQMTVVKGDAFMVIATYASGGSDDERFEFAKQIGASAAGRM
jgi:hypothetical protein